MNPDDVGLVVAAFAAGMALGISIVNAVELIRERRRRGAP